MTSYCGEAPFSCLNQLSAARLSQISDSLVAVAKAAKRRTEDSVSYARGQSALVAFMVAGTEDPETPGKEPK
jgi:hypothetical protein